MRPTSAGAATGDRNRSASPQFNKPSGGWASLRRPCGALRCTSVLAIVVTIVCAATAFKLSVVVSTSPLHRNSINNLFTHHDRTSQRPIAARGGDEGVKGKTTPSSPGEGRLPVQLHHSGGLEAGAAANSFLVQLHTVTGEGVKPRAESERRAKASSLCVFVPTNTPDDTHLFELQALIDTWLAQAPPQHRDNNNSGGSSSSPAPITTIFTENSTTLSQIRRYIAAGARPRSEASVIVAHANLDAWNAWHAHEVLSRPKLRRRGATASSILGRGQLSIPLFAFMKAVVVATQNQDGSQLGHSGQAYRRCSWFMKCDTDTYLNRRLFEARALSSLNPNAALHVGVAVEFDTKPFHHTSRYIRFHYNIGGPGYTFSRGLLDALDLGACLRDMTEEPVLLVHDDVATGYCSTFHTGAKASTRVDAEPTAAATSTALVRLVLDADLNGTASTGCLGELLAVHPCDPPLLRQLAAAEVRKSNARPTTVGGGNAAAKRRCELKLMRGAVPVVGPGWGAAATTAPDVRLLLKYWTATTSAYLPVWEKPEAQRGMRLGALMSGGLTLDGAVDTIARGGPSIVDVPERR